MTQHDTTRAAARALTAVVAGAAVVLAAGPAWAGTPAGAGAPAAWRVHFDDAAQTAEDDPPAPAPSFWDSIEFSGLVDGYYEWAFNETDLQLRNFDYVHNAFTLNFAKVAISKPVSESSRAGFRFDFGAGDTADLVNSFEPGGADYLKYVEQAYLSYLIPVGSGLTLDFGKFVTPAGGEVIENNANFNYSRGLLFALAIPYYHAGARLGYTVNDKVSVTGYLVNGWNAVKDNNADKTVGISFGLKPSEKIGVTATYLVGKEQPTGDDGGTRNLIDLVGTFSATDKLSLLANFDYGHDKVVDDGVDWYGIAFGAKYQVNDQWAFAPRYEIFNDADGFATGLPQTLQDITLTAEYKAAEGLVARFEFRTDFSDEDYFVKDSGALVGTQPSLSLGLMYAFGNK